MVDVTIEDEEPAAGPSSWGQEAGEGPPDPWAGWAADARFGWALLLLAALAAFLAYKRRGQPPSPHHAPPREGPHASPLAELERRRAMQAARDRFQQQQDVQAAACVEKTKAKEAAQRKEKIEEWEKHKLGGGYYSKCKTKETDEAVAGAAKHKNKPKLRNDDYNPLMGSAGASSYRPARSCDTGG